MTAASAQSAPESEKPTANEAAAQDTAGSAEGMTAAPPPVPDLQEEVTRLRDQWMRAVAETENVRKRAQRDVEETAKYAIAGFARDMVNVMENLQRALGSMPEDAASGPLKQLAEGIELTHKELLTIFEKHGIKRFDPVGQKFDHNLHQAIAQVEKPGSPPGTVVQVLQAGYTLYDRLLRPAMVTVTRSGETEKKVDTQA